MNIDFHDIFFVHPLTGNATNPIAHIATVWLGPLHNCRERAKFGSKSAPVLVHSEHRRVKIRPRSRLCRGLWLVPNKDFLLIKYVRTSLG